LVKGIGIRSCHPSLSGHAQLDAERAPCTPCEAVSGLGVSWEEPTTQGAPGGWWS